MTMCYSRHDRTVLPSNVRMIRIRSNIISSRFGAIIITWLSILTVAFAFTDISSSDGCTSIHTTTNVLSSKFPLVYTRTKNHFTSHYFPTRHFETIPHLFHHRHHDRSLTTIRGSSSSDNGNSNNANRPIFWKNDDDDLDLLYFNSNDDDDDDDDDDDECSNNNVKRIQFTIRGNPLPLARHRSSGKFMYNPSANKQRSFRDIFLDMLDEYDTRPTKEASTTASKLPLLLPPIPVFQTNDHLSITLIFNQKRPRSHFVNNKPGGKERLKRFLPNGDRRPPTRTDVDNLAKFVLDSLNGVLYDDDRQVVELKAVKRYDDVGECWGSTEVIAIALDDDDDDTKKEIE